MRANRWVLVAVAAALMGGAGTYQFVWTTLRAPVGTRLGVEGAALGTVFTAYVVGQTLVQFPAGSVRDRYGPRAVLLVAAGCLFAGYAGLAVVSSYPLAVAAYGVGGVGVGSAYTVAVNTPVKWFDDRRGLATGVVTTTFGGASVAAIPVVADSVDAAYTTTLFALAVVVGGLGLLAALVVRDPQSTDGDRSTVADAAGWRTVLRTWQFWVLFGVMAVVNGVGLMLVGQSTAFAAGLGLPTATATTVAAAVALADALGIVVVSGLSDRFGGERTVGASLLLCGCSLVAAVAVGRTLAPLFVLLVAATAFFRSPAFAVFPALVGRYYGTARSSENYALVYLSKVPGGIFGGTVTGLLVARLGWALSFSLGGGLLVIAGLVTFGLREPGPTSR